MKRLIPCMIVSLILWSSWAFAQDPIKVGVILLTSGRLAAFGVIAGQGIDLAAKKLNAAGGINGRPVQTIMLDSRGDPQVAYEHVRRLVEEEQVDLITGVATDEVASRLSEAARQFQVPLIVTASPTRSVTGSKCNRYTFRICPSAFQIAKVGAILAGRTDATKWTAVMAEHSASHEIWQLARRYLQEIKPDVSFVSPRNVVIVPDSTEDWGPHIARIVASGADGIFIYLPSGNFIDFVRQGNQAGFFTPDRKVVAMMGALSELLALGAGMPAGVWWSSPYWFQTSRSPANREFIEAYETNYGAPPSWQAHFGYAGLIAYAEAAKKAGSTDPEAVVRALEGLHLELPLGSVTIRPEDHQAIMHQMAARTARMSVTKRKRSFRGMGLILLFRSKEITESVEESGCSMR